MSTSYGEMLIHGINLARTGFRMLNATHELANNPDISEQTKTYAIAARVLGFAFSVYETDAIINNASAEHLMLIKECEVAEKSLEFGTRLAVTLSKAASNKCSSKDLIESIEKETLAGFLDVIRVTSEYGIYNEKHFLEMTPEERASHTRTYIDQTGSGMNSHYNAIIEKPIDEEECRRNLEFDDAVDSILTSAICALEGNYTTKIVTSIHDFVLPDTNRDIEIPPQVEVPIQRPQHTPAASRIIPGLAELVRERENQDPSNLLSLSFIPSNLYAEDPDSIFRKTTCAISNKPARHPVKDPTANGDRKIVYDRINILTWLQNESNAGRPLLSPVTRSPLDPESLIPLRAYQSLIDAKLTHFQERWLNILKDNPDLRGLPETPDAQQIIENARIELGAEYFDNPEA
ncbi:MAG: hypothetical protein FJZ57_00210 [Chlamydiae bacterium]|nr:hypothetical protein [Chlamydiota bacterium]